MSDEVKCKCGHGQEDHLYGHAECHSADMDENCFPVECDCENFEEAQ